MINHLKSFLGNRWVLALGSLLVMSMVLFTAPSAHAATAPGTATWKDPSTIVYNGISYTGPKQVVLDTAVAQAEFRAYVPPSGTSVIFFDKDTNISTTKTAYYSPKRSAVSSVAMTLNFSNTQSAVTPASPTSPTGDTNTDGENADGCKVDGIGWIVCPIATFLSKVNDGAYALAENFLVFRISEKPFSTNPAENPTYTIWSNIRNVANVLFIIAFFIVIFSQATSVGLSNYGIKKMLPRIVVSAILVNLSYYICLFAIDISNIVGAGIDGIMRAPLANLPTNSDGNWEEITAGILAGVVGTTALAVAVIVATGPLLGFLAMAALALFTALVILIARQAFLVILIVLAPLAFVAYILPNTESLFDKWRKAFIAMLVMYPMFAVIFAGSEVAATIIRSAEPAASGSWLTPIVALGVQTIPLFALPFIVKFSGGVLGRVAGIVNNRNKGVIDRARKFGDQRSMANKAALVSNKWGKTEDGKDKAGSMAKWKRRAGVGAGFVGGYEARKQFKESSRKADAEKIQQGDIAERLQSESSSLARRSTLRGETGQAIARARGQQILDKLEGEEISAAQTMIKNSQLNQDQLMNLAIKGTGTSIDGKTTLSGDFYQKAAAGMFIDQGRISVVEDILKNGTLSPAVAGSVAYKLQDAYSTLKTKGHHLNSDIIKERLISGQRVTEDDFIEASKDIAGLNPEYITTNDKLALKHLQDYVAKNQPSPGDTPEQRTKKLELIERVQDISSRALRSESAKNFTRDTKELAIQLSGMPASAAPIDLSVTTPTKLNITPVRPESGRATVGYSVENIETMSPWQVQNFVSTAGGKMEDLHTDDVAKITQALYQNPAIKSSPDVQRLYGDFAKEWEKRQGPPPPSSGPSMPPPTNQTPPPSGPTPPPSAGPNPPQPGQGGPSNP